MATRRQEHTDTITGLRNAIRAAEIQRSRHPENSPLWNAFDDQIFGLQNCVIADSIAYDRTLAGRIIVEFNLEQKPG